MTARGSISATIVLEDKELHRVDVAGGAFPSESLAALKSSIGAFLTEYMQKNSIAVGEEVDMLEEIISSDDDDDEQDGSGKKEKDKPPQQQQQRSTRCNKKRARVERAKAKAKAEAAAAATAATVAMTPR